MPTLAPVVRAAELVVGIAEEVEEELWWTGVVGLVGLVEGAMLPDATAECEMDSDVTLLTTVELGTIVPTAVIVDKLPGAAARTTKSLGCWQSKNPSRLLQQFQYSFSRLYMMSPWYSALHCRAHAGSFHVGSVQPPM